MAALSGPAPVLACPKCAAGVVARGQVWNDGFAFNLLAAVLPFLVVGTISFVVERVGTRAQTGNRGVSRTGMKRRIS
jgi:hypothetical protein